MKLIKNSIALMFLVAVAYGYAGIIRSDVSSDKYLQLGREKQFECVGHVYKDTTPTGSCVLIDSRHVLSAAHVFIDHDTRPDTVKMGNQTVVVFQPYNEHVTSPNTIHLVFNNQTVHVNKIILHPNYLNKPTTGAWDLAILELEEPITAIAPATLSYASDELNSIITGVGYGQTGPADQLDQLHPSKDKIAGENVIDSIGGIRIGDKASILFCDFDHPSRTDCNKMGSDKPLDMEYISGAGDSGGGIFRNKKGKWELIGICQGTSTDVKQLMVTGYYGQIMKATRVSAYKNWIKGQLK